MDVMNHQQAEREAELMQANREELVERIARAMRQDGTAQPLQGLHLYRRSSPLELLHGVSEPSVAVIAQGSLAGIVAGQQPPSDCGKPLPVTPAQSLTA